MFFEEFIKRVYMKNFSLILFLACIGTSLLANDGNIKDLSKKKVVVSDELIEEIQFNIITVDDSITNSEDLVVIEESAIIEDDAELEDVDLGDSDLDVFDIDDIDLNSEEFAFIVEELTILDKLKMTPAFFRLQWSNLKQHVSNYKKIYGVGSVILVVGSGFFGAYFLRNNKKDDESK